MPIYEYNCSHCHTGFEELLISAKEIVVCPKCQSKKVQRQLSVFRAPTSHNGESSVNGGCGGCTPGGCGCH
jgi:putative FmdB family regulatory protein